MNHPMLGLSKPIVLLCVYFAAWKSLLGLVALTSPGIGYDTSSSLLEQAHTTTNLDDTAVTLSSRLYKLVRWDAIYFTQISSRGYASEQEWAFSFTFSSLVSFVSQSLKFSGSGASLQSIVASAILVSHTAHLLSTLVLYLVTKTAYGISRNGFKVAFLAALLHILSPAGLFLSSPYTESLFSVMNMLGFLFYLKGIDRYRDNETLLGNLQIVLAGLVFGCGTTIRSNGLLSGLPFLYDASLTASAALSDGLGARHFSKLSALVIGGLLVAAGLVGPQAVAYQSYCSEIREQEMRPWCNSKIPSVYSWVQTHYWNVGLFRYWTLSNVPLFLLATPLLWILIYSAYRALSLAIPRKTKVPSLAVKETRHAFQEGTLTRLALPQLALAMLALTSYHVQIITRLSSGYPLWYIWLAERIVASTEYGERDQSPLRSKHLVRFMIMYGVIQGGLYASFLPPA